MPMAMVSLENIHLFFKTNHDFYQPSNVITDSFPNSLDHSLIHSITHSPALSFDDSQIQIDINILHKYIRNNYPK